MLRWIESLTASLLVRFGAVKVSLDKPFQLASGNWSPLYVDCRVLISEPAILDAITALMRLLLADVKFDVVAAGESAGIPYGAVLAAKMGCPFIYVRKEKKGYGTGSRVEGRAAKGSSTLLVEDLVTDGKSKLSFVDGLREAGLAVRDCIVVLDREQGATDLLSEQSIQLKRLCTVDTCLQCASDEGAIDKAVIDQVRQYLVDPKAWHAKKGLPFK